MNELPERHIECGECKKAVRVLYTEIIGKSMTRVAMCNDCPFLREKLRGRSQDITTFTEVVCGGCGMTLDAVKMGSNLGCPLCYEIFAEELAQELLTSERLAVKTPVIKKGTLLHTGRRPEQAGEKLPSFQLYTLHQALTETLNREDYEQAALLRDQIKKLTEGMKDKSRENGNATQ